MGLWRSRDGRSMGSGLCGIESLYGSESGGKSCLLGRSVVGAGRCGIESVDGSGICGNVSPVGSEDVGISPRMDRRVGGMGFSWEWVALWIGRFWNCAPNGVVELCGWV
jgi:hypothetical protein